MLTKATSRAWTALVRNATTSSSSSRLHSRHGGAASQLLLQQGLCTTFGPGGRVSAAVVPMGGSRRYLMSQTPGEGNNEDKAGKAEEGEQPPVDEQAKLIEKLTAENKELKDKVLYTLAEMENVRTIARRDMDSAKQFALQSFAKQLLDVADNLSRAIESVPQEVREKKDDQTSSMLATLVQGVEMTDSQLQKVFGANKITRYGAPGDKFDPHLHDALFEYEDAAREPGSVGQILKTGYKLNDRVIRPAQVGTVKKS